MWFSDTSAHTPRTPVSDRKFRTTKTAEELKREEKLENIDSKFERASNLSARGNNKPLDVEDDRGSKITVVSLKSNRTSRTVQTIQSSIDQPSPRQQQPPQKGAKLALFKAKKKVQAGFRDSSIKRIIASGLCIATFLLLVFGVFLPFWNVYEFTKDGVTTGYYGGLWNYCEVTSGVRSCHLYTESSNEHWFRAVRGFELMAFLTIVGLLALVVAYMFFLREIKYTFLQWIIVGLGFGTGILTLLGLIIYAASYSDSSHISSAYGLTFCAFFGCLITSGLFLWDKIEMDKTDSKDVVFRGMSGARSSRSRVKSRLSHVRSQRSHRSQRSRGGASQLSGQNSIALSNMESNIMSTTGKSVARSNTGKSAIESLAGRSLAGKSTTRSMRSGQKLKFSDPTVPPIQEGKS